MVEFLGQLVKAMERYLLHTDSGRTSEAGPRRTSLAPSSGAQKSSTSQSAGASSSTESPTSLSADLVQLNSGIVYEILDECMELGYPMMPSLAQLDLLIFGVSRTS
ncbi:hypothetical protein BGX31_008076 [Mortierella sp. GBA43]|nr:hypothetical protein BGX31_008076 [Mortierella sp. GBA43]